MASAGPGDPLGAIASQRSPGESRSLSFLLHLNVIGRNLSRRHHELQTLIRTRFPKVTILILPPGRVATAARLETPGGLVAAPEPIRPATVIPLRVSRRHENAVRDRKWRDYARCLERLRLNHGDTDPDVSGADFVWCMTTLDGLYSTQETANQLTQVNSKAHKTRDTLFAPWPMLR